MWQVARSPQKKVANTCYTTHVGRLIGKFFCNVALHNEAHPTTHRAKKTTTSFHEVHPRTSVATPLCTLQVAQSLIFVSQEHHTLRAHMNEPHIFASSAPGLAGVCRLVCRQVWRSARSCLHCSSLTAHIPNQWLCLISGVERTSFVSVVPHRFPVKEAWRKVYLAKHPLQHTNQSAADVIRCKQLACWHSSQRLRAQIHSHAWSLCEVRQSRPEPSRFISWTWRP